ncbi:DUF6122 family protein [Tenacibaculum piscium]|uniref:DUF6122 family protein n=1 Tax=Tenacibaculum piscium TaxID=1458515 RepID=UPI001F36447E|nr:DUF6122 family protein [Tenacibaculum piscium]MCG8182510.1 hypothetical protein [Tenacibaculum piscium]MCG8203902.1 hypothetical protein [Tenacibaculum piscium]
MQAFTHYFLHFGFPFFIGYIFFRKEWKKVALILIATMLVDLDHLLATPIFQENRCSFGFHILHTYYAMCIYFLLLFFKKPYNIIGLGLLFHMLTDLIDCLFMYNNCKQCYINTPAEAILKQITSFF